MKPMTPFLLQRPGYQWKALKELYKNEHVDDGNSQFVQKLHQGEELVNSLEKVEK